MGDLLLRILEEDPGRFVSGEEIGRRMAATRAAGAAERGAPHGSIFCADAQTGGRGRFDRRWESPPGVNLYLSLLLRPPVDPRRAPQLTLVTAVALAEAGETVVKISG